MPPNQTETKKLHAQQVKLLLAAEAVEKIKAILAE
jgi:hypothetical protein